MILRKISLIQEISSKRPRFSGKENSNSKKSIKLSSRKTSRTPRRSYTPQLPNSKRSPLSHKSKTTSLRSWTPWKANIKIRSRGFPSRILSWLSSWRNRRILLIRIIRSCMSSIRSWSEIMRARGIIMRGRFRIWSRESRNRVLHKTWSIRIKIKGSSICRRSWTQRKIPSRESCRLLIRSIGSLIRREMRRCSSLKKRRRSWVCNLTCFRIRIRSWVTKSESKRERSTNKSRKLPELSRDQSRCMDLVW